MANILVTGASSPTGVAICRALSKYSNFTTVGVDPNEWTVAQQMVDTYIQAPWADDRNFQGFLSDVVERYEFDFAFVTITREIRTAWEVFLPAWMATPYSTDLCEDKMRFAYKMFEFDILHPETFPDVERRMGDGPWIVKPIDGEGSKRTWEVATKKAIRALRNEHPDLIIQPKLQGLEWEADVFATAGALLGGVAFIKHRMKGGITMKAETIPLEMVQGALEQVIDACELDGPLNIGGFMCEDGNYILEVNPRFSHGFLIGEAAGADPIRFYLDFLHEGAADRRLLRYQQGVKFERFYAELVC